MITSVLDTEVFENYFLLKFKTLGKETTTNFEIYDGHPFDCASVEVIMRTNLTIGFNSINFDIPLIYMAIAGRSMKQIKEAANEIILHGKKPWDLEKKYNFKIPRDLNHIDIIEVLPGRASLKAYGGRTHTKQLQDLPIEPQAFIRVADRERLIEYCYNDLVITEELYGMILPQINLREKMGKKYNLDLRSKSDAQIAEAIIKVELGKLTGKKVERPPLNTDKVYRYKKPDFLPDTPLVSDIAKLKFSVTQAGKLNMPDELSDVKIKIGGSEYKMGIGGLHSCEKSVAHIAAPGEYIIDRDVAGYYPAIILGLSLYPEHLGEKFIDVYRYIVKTRLKAKREGDKVTSDSLKIVANGSYGKFGSPWSALYSPQLLLQTTLTGQLALLMLIERLTEKGISVISANTDGVTFKTRDKATADKVVAEWEKVTGFETEETLYNALYSRDVNNYVALKRGGGFKLKGAYVPPGFAKNPTGEIVTDAVLSYLSSGVPVATTITKCDDIRKFVALRSVTGGAVCGTKYLGKAVRWYYSTASDTAIYYKVNGYLVPKTQGAKPVMTLPNEFPEDVDFDWYIREANEVLVDIGAIKEETDECQRKRK